MRNRNNAIQARYAYLSDLFRAIAFLFQELESPHDLAPGDVAHLESLLRSYKRLPLRVVNAPRVPNLSAYRIFIRDFHHLVDKTKGNLFDQMRAVWKNTDEATKRLCRDRALEENERKTRGLRRRKERRNRFAHDTGGSMGEEDSSK